MSHSNSNSSSSANGISSEELLLRSSEWSLACDNMILKRLKDFSESLVKKSREISLDCDLLLDDVDSLGFKVSNITNKFLMLGNTHFVENCVQDFEECCANDESNLSHVKPETKAEKEAVLIGKMKEAIRVGVSVQRKREESRSTGLEDSCRSMDSRASSSVNLAHLIGSSKFFSSRYCGLLDENRVLRPSKPESAFSNSSNYDNSSVQGQAGTVVSEEVPTSPSPIISESTSYEKIVPILSVSSNVIPDYPPDENIRKAVSGHEAVRRSLEEKLKGMQSVSQTKNPESTYFVEPSMPPSSPSPSSNGSSSLGDIGSSKAEACTAPKVSTRSPSPFEDRPPPVMDLSDSDEDIFKPIAKSSGHPPSFDDFFKNQKIFQPVFNPSVFQPPPVTDNARSNSSHENDDNAQSRKQNSHNQLPNSQHTILNPSTAMQGSAIEHTSRSAQPSANTNTNKTETILKKEPVEYQRKRSPSPKKISIFDSSDSDDDLFANFGQKKQTKKNNRPASESQTFHRPDHRPPPILDISDDSDEDIFKSFSSRKPLFAEKMSPPRLSGREQLRENLESSNLISPSVNEDALKKPALPKGSEMPKWDLFKDGDSISEGSMIHSELEPSSFTADISPGELAVESRDTHWPADGSPTNSDQSASLESSRRNSVGGKEDTSNQDFATETILREEKPDTAESVTTSSVASAEQNYSLIPETNSLFSDNSHAAPELRQDHSIIVSIQKEAKPAPIKSIFESSDSDDDLFSGGSKRTKTTPTLGYTSPIPVREPPEIPEDVPQSRERTLPRLDLSDSDEDIFKTLAKSSRTDLPKPVEIPPPTTVAEELFYPINHEAPKNSVQNHREQSSPISAMPPKSYQGTSIFDSSDSDDDLFASNAKVRSAPSLKNLVQRSKPLGKPANISSKRAASLFGESEDEEENLFGGGSKGRKVFSEIGGKSSKSAEKQNSQSRLPTDCLVEDSGARPNIKVLSRDKGSKEKLFTAVAKNLESILSAKIASPTFQNAEVSLISPVSPNESVSFDEKASTDNLLRCMTKDRPKILQRRRPPSSLIRRQFSQNSVSELHPDSEELGPFV